MARTRIVATVGPATETESQVRALIDAGADVLRLNASHSSVEELAHHIEMIRGIASSEPVGILIDLQGPKLRTTGRVHGEVGDVIDLALPETVLAGDPVLLADGAMHLQVIDPGRSRVVTAGDIPVGKGINLPSSRLDIPSITDADRKALDLARRAGVDYVALSFVRRASDLDELRGSGVPVIAKVEKAEAVEHLESIVDAADAVMVARGDLGVEIPIERVPIVQKRIIRLANASAKPVITATQMLRSMVDNVLPTRAEATDVANAVLDGTDAVMLSEETAVGRYPMHAVRAMRRITDEAEGVLSPRIGRPHDGPADDASYVARLAVLAAQHLGAAAIIVPTRTGFTARQVARYRPNIPIIALATHRSVWRRLSLVWGVTPVMGPAFGPGAEAVLWQYTDPVRRSGLVGAGSKVVLTAGWPIGSGGITNLLHVAEL